jgi:hypothetical protein
MMYIFIMIHLYEEDVLRIGYKYALLFLYITLKVVVIV